MAETRKKRRGDRKAGRWLRSLDPLYAFTPFIMKEKNDSLNYFSDKVDISTGEEFLRGLRADGVKGIGTLHLFLACYTRTVAKYPALNRYVAGQRIYARNYIECVMTVKKKLTIDSGETCFKVRFDPTDSIIDIYNKVEECITAIKEETEETGTDKIAAIFAKFPRFLIRAALSVLRWMDYHDLIPASLIWASPFHGSMVVTDLGSLGIPPVFHHIYNFGDIPLFLAIGAKRSENEVQRDGSVREHRYVDFTVTSDERICDGHYFSVAFRYMKYLMRNPKLLAEKLDPSEVVEDVD